MSSSNVIRLGGLALILSSVLFIISSLIGLYLNLNPRASSVVFQFRSPIALVAGPLEMLGLLGLYARRPEAMGIFGLIAFLVTFLGTFLAAGTHWHETFVIPSIALVDFESLQSLEFDRPGPYGFGLILTVQLVFLGWALFGVAILRARLYPRLAAILLIVFSLLYWMLDTLLVLVVGPPGPGSILPHIGTVIIILSNVVLAWLGFALWTGRSAPEDPAREPGF